MAGIAAGLIDPRGSTGPGRNPSPPWAGNKPTNWPEEPPCTHCRQQAPVRRHHSPPEGTAGHRHSVPRITQCDPGSDRATRSSRHWQLPLTLSPKLRDARSGLGVPPAYAAVIAASCPGAHNQSCSTGMAVTIPPASAPYAIRVAGMRTPGITANGNAGSVFRGWLS
jgi:hypothetical protein